ncbi:major facilitator superfamily domain-containing protein [Aspergillus karnatakaensis]|uniref:major facilitator superfamily domain-containing protein n=1 Tax=Aspergillus karnatakaensis TaxID=1810916 RepID=UPI003CCD4804
MELLYSAFSHRTRKAITYQASFSAMFSGISSFIYYPAIQPLSGSLHVSIAAINLTVSDLIVAGIVPSIIGTMADEAGRRPVSILTFTIYFAANLGLALQSSYVALVILRCLQSAGSAGTIAIAYGVIADVTTPQERGGYVGILMTFTNSAPSLAPIIGGALVQELSWRWIFWLLTIVSGANLFSLVLFFPETSRRIVGNGSVHPGFRINQSLYCMYTRCRKLNQPSASAETSGFSLNRLIPNPIACLTALLDKATLITIIVGSIQYAIYSALGTSLSAQLADRYSLDGLIAGLAFLPSGIGGLLAAFLTGKLVDHDFQVVRRSLPTSLNVETGGPSSANVESLDFPIEKARLRSVLPFFVTASIATLAYGWTVHFGVHLAVPLVMQFLSGGSQVAMFVICGTLLTDININNSATAQASYSIVRCALAAAAVALLDPIIQGIGLGWCLTLYTLLSMVCLPLSWILAAKGWEWRRAKARAQRDSM